MEQQYRENPSRTPYQLSLSSSGAGYFMLSWLTAKGAKKVDITVTPKVIGNRLILIDS